nr:exonuclease SbcC [Blastococcus saxobsidens]
MRVVVRYAVEAAVEVLPLVEQDHPTDLRARAAVDAAWAFVLGAERTNLQRSTAVEAHRAARSATSEAAAHAARAAGDAAAAAYLHPLAKATQVGHILGSAARAARAAEAAAGDDPSVGDEWIERARRRATPRLVEVLRRYPSAPTGAGRVARLLSALDTGLRSG